MSDFLYDQYQSLNKDDLFDILLHPENYQAEAIPVAKKVISEKRWTNDLNKKLDEIKKKHEKDQEKFQLEVEEKANYYKNVVAFKNQGNSFQVRIPDIPKLEGALEEKEIAFFREDKNIGVQLDTYPTQSYYFKDEDVEAVDKLTQELGLITAPYADAKPFFFFELKALVVIIAICILLAYIFIQISE